MTTFEKMINNRRHAAPGNATPIKKIGGLTIDFSHQKFSQEFLEAFIEQAEKQKIIERFAEIYSGKEVNKTESRAVDHFEYRKKETLRKRWAIEAQKSMTELGERINKQKYEAIIFFGIGGSQLGPELIQQTLCYKASKKIIFITGSDPIEAQQKTKGLNLAECGFILASKSFSTIETLRSFEDVTKKKHLEDTYAITSNRAGAETIGVPSKNILVFSDATGGRFSIWSPINLLLLIQMGEKATKEFNLGGNEADENVLNSRSLEDIGSIYMSAQDIFHNNILGNETSAILSYDWPLRGFYRYAQQLEMESNGKQVDQNGRSIDYQTNPIVWGGYGPVSQHSFYQQIFQGTKDMNLYFLASREHENKLNTAQYLGQTHSLSRGSDTSEPAHKQVNKRRFTTIDMKNISPRTMGNLIATWENKTILNSLLWNINAFDQWGVELGKANTKKYIK
jgi:glucose-6-phosphate isomerase